MKSYLNKITAMSAALLLLATSFAFAQDSTKSKMHEHKHHMEMPVPPGKMDSSGHMNGMKMDHNMMMNMDRKNMQHNTKMDMKEKPIDVDAVDVNKNGKVYQCQMDYDVLSDKPGRDPKCGMKLKEVTLEKAKENLVKNGYKVKETPGQK